MGFKVDSSFLRFLTMGALGAQSVALELERRGFEPVELERYSGCNKIWATKVKRLRLPDLLCVRTGLRVEVRTKSKLTIRMSDAPKNSDRAWDAGLRDRDLIALIVCVSHAGKPTAAERAAYFTVKDLRSSAGSSKLGKMKSQSEGAEQDRTWPAVIPQRSGEVVSVTPSKLVVRWTDNLGLAKRQTYNVAGKNVYVQPGDHVNAGIDVLAGTPAAIADPAVFLKDKYDPILEIDRDSKIDRYSAAKALRFREDLRTKAIPVLEARLRLETDPRVALEVAASAAALASQAGENYLSVALRRDEPVDMSMESILIATELKTAFARDELLYAARSFPKGDERRQAAIWGLGKAGVRCYSELIQFIADEDEGAAFHAICGFGSDAPEDVVTELTKILLRADTRMAAAASEALRRIGNQDVLTELIEASSQDGKYNDWVLATLGRMPEAMVRARLKGEPLLERLAPTLLLGEGATWLSTEDAASSLAFLAKQDLFELGES